MQLVNECFEIVKKDYLKFLNKEKIYKKSIAIHVKSLKKIYIPIAFWINKKYLQKGNTLLLGLSASQGSGKTTVAAILSIILKFFFKRTVCVISIDDFYKTLRERNKMAKQKHPLLKTRGVPGTHDIKLVEKFFLSIKNKKFRKIKLPKFNKLIDDRFKKNHWYNINKKPEIVILEGWCVGAKAERSSSLKKPINFLEKYEDKDLIWRKYVNEKLKKEYKKVFSMIDHYVFMKVPNFKMVFKWRLLQEKKLKKKSNYKKKTMSYNEIKRFIMFYQRITLQMIKDLSKSANVVMFLKKIMKLKKCYLKHKKMKFLLKKLLIVLLFIGINESKANTLFDTLNSAYLNNSKLNAERANMRATIEEKRESVSEFLPSVTISGYVGEQDNVSSGSDSNFRPSEQAMTIEQTIFQGGSGIANFKKKKHGQSLGEFKLKKTEQEILLEAAKAHTELILNRKKVNINLTNVDLLERQVETDQNRLEKGEINLTDLAQSESSLAGAKAQLIAVQNNLVTSKSNFEMVVGSKPPENIQEIKDNNLNLPESLAAAYKISNTENPDLIIALLEFKQSKLDVIIAGSDFSPSATLSYKIAEQDDISATVKDRTQQTVTATATWPLFAGGKNIFNLRKVQQLRNQKELLYQDSKKKAETNVAIAWSSYQSSKSVLESIRSQVKAAEIANEGITQEYESGNNRTTLEVIQSRTILLNSRINLATAERDFLISQFNLLSSIGRLTAKQLNLSF